MHPLLAADKLYYSIGEAKEITGVEPHVLRYWETEFPTFRPKKSRTGQRNYTRKDIEQIFEIRRLLYEEKFTIKGAKNKLKEKMPSLQEEATEVEAPFPSADSQLVFDQVEKAVNLQLPDRGFLESLKEQLLSLSQHLKKRY
jgi:DNA-binding transcriptional MerR regulator